VTHIGEIRSGRGLTVVDARGDAVDMAARAFDHFRP
jgi:hypothetical protein